MQELAEIYGSERLPEGVKIGQHLVAFRIQRAEGGLPGACELSDVANVLFRLLERRAKQFSGRTRECYQEARDGLKIAWASILVAEGWALFDRREPPDVTAARVKAEQETERAEVAGEVRRASEPDHVPSEVRAAWPEGAEQKVQLKEELLGGQKEREEEGEGVP